MKKHSKDYFHLFYSQLFANTGDLLTVVGLISVVYSMTSKTTAASMIPIIFTSGLFVSSFISNYIYQYFTQKQILWIFQGLKLVSLSIIASLLMFERSPIFIFILLFINALFDGFTNPIKNAMIPFIEKKEYITSANALMNMMSSMVQLSTWALGGFLMSLIGAKYLFLFALVLEILSYFFIIQLSERHIYNNEKENILNSFKTVLRHNYSNKLSLYLNLSIIFESVATSIWVAAIILTYTRTFLHVDDFWFGLINAAFFSGTIIAGLWMNDKDQFFTKISYPIIIYIPLILAFINASFILHQSVLLALLMSLLMGIFEDSRYISLNSVVQREIPKEALTSTYILNNLLSSIFFSLGTLGISLVVDNQGVMWAYVISGVAYVLTFILGLYFKIAIKN
ncbi:MFS transporter [Staphylococcus hominis]|uniref:MFS transporter n=1 Tax=Staphylococcus hominis TaxID=1290 RepID=UPI000D1E170E|nr:MFS transporter [Staphylococcus hominis]MCE4950073.1 MFS transporter [Staphylococcus hominis]MCE4952346.1 MFS transporter [Staphylococcus hominis]MCE4974692.1 MFS transporter [Staphylococcus hominis]PTK22860.1 MFS transporter [Staphylococcus hominis]PTK26342.1 MFS transporter [Staphylococcus hominis]